MTKTLLLLLFNFCLIGLSFAQNKPIEELQAIALKLKADADQKAKEASELRKQAFAKKIASLKEKDVLKKAALKDEVAQLDANTKILIADVNNIKGVHFKLSLPVSVGGDTDRGLKN